MSALNIVRVENKKQLSQFIDFPFRIYRDSKYWVPPLRLQVEETLDVEKNPFFRHAYRTLWLAVRNDEIVGRIAGIIDDQHNKIHAETTAFFGFFECIEDSTVSSALFETVVNWAKDRNMNVIRGPMNPSTNHECALLVEGFEDSPAVMMTYNHRYYLKLIEDFGFSKSMDMLAYCINYDRPFAPRLLAHAERVKAKGSVVIRPIRMNDFDQEVERVLNVYNDAWESNWGFVPMLDYEFRHMAKEMKLVLDPRFLLLAEIRGEVIGFSLALPDVYQAQIKIRDGKLFPFGIFKLLWFLKGPFRAKTVNRVRILTLGIKKKYQELGLGPLFYIEYLNTAKKSGYPSGEASWVLENNIPMNKAAKLMGGQETKRYRIFEKTI